MPQARNEEALTDEEARVSRGLVISLVKPVRVRTPWGVNSTDRQRIVVIKKLP